MAALETCKENFAPLKGGRSARGMLEAVTMQSKPNELELKLRSERQLRSVSGGVIICLLKGGLALSDYCRREHCPVFRDVVDTI